MNFIDDEHELFFMNKVQELSKYKKIKPYYISLIYTLGISKTTRNNFANIFNIETGEINIDAIENSWQTDSSKKVTRMAFSLWNGCNYDSTQDIENEKISKMYNPNELFSCSYAPYFYEGVKLRFPEYTKDEGIEMEL